MVRERWLSQHGLRPTFLGAEVTEQAYCSAVARAISAAPKSLSFEAKYPEEHANLWTKSLKQVRDM